MRFQESIYSDSIKYTKLEFSFGNFYLFNNFIISEIHEGIHFNWDKILEVIGALIDYYGEYIEIAYIANRVNSYSTEPHLWYRFHDEFNFIIACATVAYNDFGYINASIEKQCAQISFKRCRNLPEAINWVNKLKELNPH